MTRPVSLHRNSPTQNNLANHTIELQNYKDD